MSQKHEKIRMLLKCIIHLLVLVSTITGRVSASYFALLVGIHVGLASFTVEIKRFCYSSRN